MGELVENLLVNHFCILSVIVITENRNRCVLSIDKNTGL
jgi:hypothetical protein